jgi:hypothetical protein
MLVDMFNLKQEVWYIMFQEIESARLLLKKWIEDDFADNLAIFLMVCFFILFLNFAFGMMLGWKWFMFEAVVIGTSYGLYKWVSK